MLMYSLIYKTEWTDWKDIFINYLISFIDHAYLQDIRFDNHQYINEIYH